MAHGPVFRDFNFAKDKEAAAQIVAMNLPLILVPYDAGINLAIDDADLANLSRAGGVLKWITAGAAGWLDFWKSDMGQPAFYPFDLAAAAYVLHPTSFDCATVHASVMRDDAVWTSWFYSPKALLVGPVTPPLTGAPKGKLTVYCPSTRPGLKRKVLAELAAYAN